MLVRERAQRLHGGAARAEHAMHVGQRVGVDLLGTGEAQPLAVEDEAAQRLGAAQLAVVHRRELLHQPRLAQQRAELARGALPVDAPHARRPAVRSMKCCSTRERIERLLPI